MKVGITFSCFDLFHAGHVAMLKEAKTQCDYLIVGLQTDPTIDRPEKNRPIQTVFERYVQLRACKYIDEIIPYATEKDVEDILLTYQIDVRIIGEDYLQKSFTGKQICVDKNITIYYNRRQHSFSTSELRQRIYERTLDREVQTQHS
jgi:glycerol-3-phosphate cytidylyltransferase